MFDKFNEAIRNWKSLLPMLKPFVRNETKSAVRKKKMDVTRAPNTYTIGVCDPGDDPATGTIYIPYQSDVADARVGSSVWVEWKYDNFSTAVAVSHGGGVSAPKSIKSYDDVSHRLATADQESLFRDNNMFWFHATSTMTDRPNSLDGTILQFMWDNSSPNWCSQLFLGHNLNTAMYIRARTDQAWGTWSRVFDEKNFYPRYKYVNGSVASVYGSNADVCSTSLPAGYFYVIYAHVHTNNASAITTNVNVTNVDYGSGNRTGANSGGGVDSTFFLTAKSTATTVTLQSYGYANATYTYTGFMMIFQYPAMATF